jgi:hypothetical protein
VKFESQNPGGSIEDRIAQAMIEAAPAPGPPACTGARQRAPSQGRGIVAEYGVLLQNRA